MASQPHGRGSYQAIVGVCTHPSTAVGLTRMNQSLPPPGHLQLRSPDRHTACLSSPKQRSQGEKATDRSLGPRARTPARSSGRTGSRGPGHWEQGGEITGRSSTCGWLRAQGRPWAQTPGGATAACRPGRGRRWAGILEGNLTAGGRGRASLGPGLPEHSCQPTSPPAGAMFLGVRAVPFCCD